MLVFKSKAHLKLMELLWLLWNKLKLFKSVQKLSKKFIHATVDVVVDAAVVVADFVAVTIDFISYFIEKNKWENNLELVLS